MAEARILSVVASPGQVAKYDYEYKRCGVCNVFMACEPLAGKRMARITERKAKIDWACFLEEIATQYKEAEKITLVMDNLNTHTPDRFMKHFNRIGQKHYGTDSNLCTPRSTEAG
jgi:hypothetical protein